MNNTKTNTNGTKQNVLMILTGVICGFANGFFGGGGGMIIVPMFIFLLKMKPKNAHATALAVILPVTVLSSIIYLLGGEFKFDIGLSVTLGVFLGGIIGALILKKIDNKLIAKIFAFVMVVAGVKLLFF